MRILVTFAVEAEFAPWRRRHAFDAASMPTPIGLQSYSFYRGTVFENDVDVLLTGIGWEGEKSSNRPRFVLRELLKNAPDVCISTGLAGGLKADMRCGDIVAASEVSLRMGGDTFRSGSNLLAIARDCGARIEKRQITETHIVSDSSAKSALANFGDFVDMEGYYILQIVSGTRVPAISVRAISDTLEQNLPPGIEKFVDRQGHVQALPLLKAIAAHPGRIPSLLSFGAHSRDAAVSLADFLDRFLEAAGEDRSEAQAKREKVAAR
jgi:nucleoside phosphorylase